jgi:hypothetical protein
LVRKVSEQLKNKKIRAADAKEVGVGNPAEETCCYPNKFNVTFQQLFVNTVMVLRQKFPLASTSLGFTSTDFALRSWPWRRSNLLICSKTLRRMN